MASGLIDEQDTLVLTLPVEGTSIPLSSPSPPPLQGYKAKPRSQHPPDTANQKLLWKTLRGSSSSLNISSPPCKASFWLLRLPPATPEPPAFHGTCDLCNLQSPQAVSSGLDLQVTPLLSPGEEKARLASAR